MSQTKECPKCGTEHRLHIKKCGCGHQFGQMARQQDESRDPMWGCCEYSTGTSRCHYPGTFKDSVTGDGRWFCSAHERESDPVMGSTIVYKSHEDYPNPDWSVNAVKRRYELRTIKAISDSRNKPATQYQASKPGKDWAHRVMERIQQGETLPIISEAMAKEALGQNQA